MIIGIPRETYRHEHRVGLVPFAASRLVRLGHTVLVESGAGDAAHFSPRDYQAAGGEVVYSRDEVYRRSDLLCRVGVLAADELEFLDPGSVLCSFQHLAVSDREQVQRLMELDTTLIGYEIIRDAHGELPVLTPFSEMGGLLAVQLAAYYLHTSAGGRGVLMGNIPGVAPPTVLILGAGTVGRSAARQALAAGAHVIVLDHDVRRLRAVHQALGAQVVTSITAAERVERYTAIADVVIGAVLIPGSPAPRLVSEDMVRQMKPGSVVVDLSIDQGGCLETSRPTDLDDPTFTVHGVVHYCVPNLTANIARTASRALATAALPYLTNLAQDGLDDALRRDPGLADGVYLYRGKLVHEGVGRALGIAVTPLGELLGRKGAS